MGRCNSDGHVIVLNPEFKTIGHSQVLTNTYWDSGLFSIMMLYGKIYTALTLTPEHCPMPELFYNSVIRFDIGEIPDDPLSNPEIIFVLLMLDQQGQHNGDGMIVTLNEKIFLGIGEGFFQDAPEENDNFYYGKILELDPESVETLVIRAKNSSGTPSRQSQSLA